MLARLGPDSSVAGVWGLPWGLYGPKVTLCGLFVPLLRIVFSPEMPEMLVVDAVQSEPGSEPFFPITGENTGENRKKEISSPWIRQEAQCFRALLALFQLSDNRGSNLH